MLAPHDARRSTERGQIHQLDVIAILHHRSCRTPRTHRPTKTLLNHDPQQPVAVIEADERDVGQADQDLERARTIDDHRGSSRTWMASDTSTLAGPLSLRADPHTPLRSEEPP